MPEAAAPLILAVGGEETDEFHRQTQTYAELWRTRGLALETMVLEGHNHYTIVDALGDPTFELTSAIRRQRLIPERPGPRNVVPWGEGRDRT